MAVVTFGCSSVLSLLPLLLGVGLLFVNGRSLAGWFLTCTGAVIIWVFRTMMLACIHVDFPLLPYESACNSRASRSTKRQ